MSDLKSAISEKLTAGGTWFWAAVIIGFAIRLYLLIITGGTSDVAIWQEHAAGVEKFGLIGYYHANPLMNHPPFAGAVSYGLLKAAEATGIPFAFLLRLPFALFDAGTAFILLLTLKNSRWRFTLTICYWLCPLTIIFSAFHGNTDSSVAFFLMLCFYLVTNGKTALAGAVLGISLWFKIPGILAMPAFLFFLKGWKDRLRFLAMAGLAGVATYLPALFSDAAIVYKNVFAYQGQMIQTTAGVPVWGIRIFLMRFFDLVGVKWQLRLARPILFYLENNALLCVAATIIYSALRSWNIPKGAKRSAVELGKTIAGVYTIFYGFSSYWSFQYFAWSIPFWFFAGGTSRGGAAFAVPAIGLASAYIYGLYWLVCGNPWLAGKWDFAGHPHWPDFLENIRDLTVLFFLAASCFFLLREIMVKIAEWFKWHKTSPSGKPK